MRMFPSDRPPDLTTMTYLSILYEQYENSETLNSYD